MGPDIIYHIRLQSYLYSGTDYRRDGILTYFIVAGLFSCGYLIRDKKYIKWIMELFTIVALIQSLLIIIDIDAINKQLGLTENSSVFLI